MNPRGVCLIIEDDHDIRDLLRLILDRMGFEVHAASTGGEAVAAAQALHTLSW